MSSYNNNGYSNNGGHANGSGGRSGGNGGNSGFRGDRRENEQYNDARRQQNISILESTLSIVQRGMYVANGRRVGLNYTPNQMKEARVYLPADIDVLKKSSTAAGTPCAGTDAFGNGEVSVRFSCENTDTLALTEKRYRECVEAGEKEPKILVLNLASAFRPGGGSRTGATAQEEDLCRKTSLLVSLESDAAKKFYDYNKTLNTKLNSDAVILSPFVDVIKDSGNKLLASPYPVSVITCAAPNISRGMEGKSQQEYRKLLSRRIEGMLLVAAANGYRHLILGAFGCGVFGNDAAVVSDVFAEVIHEFAYEGRGSGELFETIDFAVLCRPEKDYNYREFCRNFLSRD